VPATTPNPFLPWPFSGMVGRMNKRVSISEQHPLRV
jgi:hypothetical protein